MAVKTKPPETTFLIGITRILTKSGSPLSYSACDCDSEKMYYNFVQYFEQYS